MLLQYQDKTLRMVPTGAATIQKYHLGKKYTKHVIIHNILRGNVTQMYFLQITRKVIITHSKYECLKTLGSSLIRNT